MGAIAEILKASGSLVKELPSNKEIYETDNTDLKEIVLFHKKGNSDSWVSTEDFNLMAESRQNVDNDGEEIQNKEKNDIPLYVSEMLIRVRKGIVGFFEKIIKQNRTDKMLMTKLEKNLENNKETQGPLPKDATVRKAEETNGKIKTVSAEELENSPREHGGRGRDARVK